MLNHNFKKWSEDQRSLILSSKFVLEISFAHAYFTAALRKLENVVKPLFGRKGRAKTYYTAGGV